MKTPTPAKKPAKKYGPELYDGPFCIISIVDNRAFKRPFFQVLDHDPNHEDRIAFFGRFQAALQARQLTVKGITTDGSALYPAPSKLSGATCPTQSANSIF